MTHLTLGISPCPNDVFIFSGLLLDRIDSAGLRFRVDYEDVESLNGRAQRGELDVVKISYANYIRCREQYNLLGCGGALGRGVGPLLLSHDGGWNPDGEVLVPGENTTANFLLDHYAQRPLRKRFLPFDALYAELCEARGTQGVVIHEKRFTYEKDRLHLIADLGQHWEEQTGHAIPLGAIVTRKTLGLDTQLEALIRSSLQWAYAHYDDAFALCRRHAQQDLSAGVIEAHIELYVNHYSEDLGADGQAAVDYFLAQQQRFLRRE
jgi:1,4-dihydroxy-6-naphthoate synthase